MNVPGRKNAVKMAMNFIFAPSLAVFAMIDCWIERSRAAITLLTYEISVVCSAATAGQERLTMPTLMLICCCRLSISVLY